MSKEQELIVDGQLEGVGVAIDVKYRIRFDYQPAEKETRFYPGCDESFSINSVAMQMRAGTWVDLTSAEYDNGDMLQHIKDAREQARRDAAFDRYFNNMEAA